ncbi:MAG: hypothetical protein J0M00_01585 [Burkholderiales bacterium]|nr:hypothetical protein [Burkholderiales bacterium]
MNFAFISVQPVPSDEPGRVRFVGRVVTADDYHNRGPSAATPNTPPADTSAEASWLAKEWAGRNGYEIRNVDRVIG